MGCIACDDSGARLAVADDGGDVHVYDVRAGGSSGKGGKSGFGGLRRALRAAHAPIASACAFRRDEERSQLLTAGLDSTLALWETTSGKLRRRWNAAAVDRSGEGKMCNPPFVHSVSVDQSGRLAVAARGDGALGVYSLHAAALGKGGGGNSMNRRGGRKGAAPPSAPAVHLAQAEPHSAATAAAAFCGPGDALVASGGVDRRLCLWRWQAPACAELAAGDDDRCDGTISIETFALKRKVNALAVLQHSTATGSGGGSGSGDGEVVRLAIADTGTKLKLFELRA